MGNGRWAPSVTVAAVIEHGGRYLLVEEHTPEGLKLNNPAGHLDPQETLVQAVVREVREETARAFVAEALVGVYLSRFQRPATGEDVTYLRFAFTGRVGEADAAAALDDGIVRTLWLTRAEIAAEGARGRLRSPLVERCIDDHAAGRRVPLEALQADPTLFAPEIKR